MTSMSSDLAHESQLRQQCDDVLAAIDAALAAKGPVPEMAEGDVLERRVVALRDTLINVLRGDPATEEVGRLRVALGSVNTALSLIAGVEYPSKGPERGLLKEAKGVLRRLRSDLERA